MPGLNELKYLSSSASSFVSQSGSEIGSKSVSNAVSNLPKHFRSPRPNPKDTQEARWMNCVMVAMQNIFSASGKTGEAENMSNIMQNFINKARNGGIRLDIDKLRRTYPDNWQNIAKAFSSGDKEAVEKFLISQKTGTARSGVTTEGVQLFLSQCGAEPEQVIPALCMPKVMSAIDAGKPIMIRDKKLIPMAAKIQPKSFPDGPLPGGHVYMVYKGPDYKYYVMDSNLDKQVEISRETLSKELMSDNRTGIIFNRKPDIPPFLL